MIIQLKGNVSYAITLDPTVWIFDDRKVLLDEAFSENVKSTHEVNQLEKAAERWNKEVYQQKVRPPVDKSISKFERDKILKNSYVMPINEFLEHAEIKPDATDVILITKNGEVNISLSELHNCCLLFAVKGKPLENNGPVHLYFSDGSNKENPITGVQKIIIT